MANPSGTARSFQLEGWEQSDFPIVCETCLGDNPQVRMQKAERDKECKICNRPFTVFRWQPGRHARTKNTIVCQMCARVKNVCQVCLYDLQWGLPVQIRDHFLEGGGDGAQGQASILDVPSSRVNRDYAVHRQERMPQPDAGFDKVPHHPILEKLRRTAPYYPRNQERVCSFWKKGNCSRGELCPYRHEEDNHDPALANQKIKNRYFGKDDPVAKKIMRKHEEESKRHTSDKNTPPPPNT